jgi:hypothetical protein
MTWIFLCRASRSSCSILLSVEVDGDDETVETQHLGEDENEDHTDEEARLLGRTSDPGVADDADGEARGEAGEADRQTGTKMHESSAMI